MNIIFVGRLIYAKGVQDLISACGTLWREHNYVKLVIVGDGPYRQQLLNCVGDELIKLNEPDDPTPLDEWRGELNHAGVMKALKESDIFVNPSYSEGLPTSVMEAASVGLPIIATDVGGTSEIITPGCTGYLYEPHDVAALTMLLKNLIEHPETREIFGRGAKAYVQEVFAWDRITEQYEDLLKEVTHR